MQRLKFAKTLFVSLCLLIGITTPQFLYAAETKDDTSNVWKAVIHYSEWEKYWLGTWENNECYGRLIGKNKTVDFFITTENESPCLCKESDRKNAPSKMAHVYIQDTNFIFSVHDLSGKAVASMDINDTSSCTAGEFVKKALMGFNAKQKTSITLPIPEVKKINFPAKEENLSNKAVIDGVKRSAPLLGIKGQKVLIGRFRLEDPFLWIYDEQENIAYKVWFSSVLALSNEKNCLCDASVFRLNYPTEDDEKKFFTFLKDKIKSDSIAINLR